MLGGLPGKEKREKGGQGIQTNKMDGAGEVLPLSSCSCIQLRHVRAASPTLHWCQQERRAWTLQKEISALISPLYLHCVCFLHWC